MSGGPAGVDDIRAARELLRGVIVETPVLRSGWLSERIGGPVHLKCENVQRTGSFKIRGAYVRIARLSDEERAGGIVAASAGNHAQGVALAAELLGGKAVVYMPEGAPLPKVEATRSYGAEVVFRSPGVDACLAAATEHADDHGAVFIHPFDHPDVVAGQGTVGLEILEQVPDVKTILVGMGGGGLISGIASAVKALRPDVRIVGVQAERAAAFPPSLDAGRPVTIRPAATMADGISVGRPGDLTFELVSTLVDSVLTVSEESLARALVLCLERSKQVVEPAGAVGVAVLLDRSPLLVPPIVTVLSGGNIDPLLLHRTLRHGLAGAGRYLTFRCRLRDRPGALLNLLGELAELSVNVIDVAHDRMAALLSTDETEVTLHVETRGPVHRDEVLAHLRRNGYVRSP
ncbi:threonine ammonia-lyase [Actinomadura kijaniata]|uniref:threonine ammonia-lyase n=1 Tax=Actinomadura kijaniata TaxID=46161 RepID=UPI003F1D8D80